MKRNVLRRELKKEISAIYNNFLPGKGVEAFGAALKCSIQRFGEVSTFEIESLYMETEFHLMVRGLVKIGKKEPFYFALMDTRDLFSPPPIPKDIIGFIGKVGKLLDEQDVPMTGRWIRYLDPESSQVIERQIPDPEEAPK